MPEGVIGANLRHLLEFSTEKVRVLLLEVFFFF